jgi:hypothetical protein
MTTEAYFDQIIPRREQVAEFIRASGPKNDRGWTFDAELGWVHVDGISRGDGVDGTDTFYYANAADGRTLGTFTAPSRIHAYGDSFTYCDQVNNGETWEDYLSARLQEPVRNYGVGDYSVYQAYRRMRQVAAAGQHDAEYVILNIFCDDHERNLVSWCDMRGGSRTPSGFTRPHLRVNVGADTFEECENLIQSPEGVYQLCDRHWVSEMFHDDPVLPLGIARRAPECAAEHLDSFAQGFGVAIDRLTATDPVAAVEEVFGIAAFYSTCRVIELVEQFIEASGKKLMIVLSYGQRFVIDLIAGKPRFDQPIVDFLATRDYPVIDMRDAFAAEFEHSTLDVEKYLDNYFTSHHSPAGNFFTAEVLLEPILQWVDPQPAPYSNPAAGPVRG